MHASPTPTLLNVQPFAELARGPVASVFKAYDRDAGEVVLLKALRPAAASDPERRARFAEEARLAAGVSHPNVVRVRHVDEEAGALVADWVEGRDLQAVLDDTGPLPAPLASFVAREAALGLAAVHAAGILHRDIKPANVLLGFDGTVRLTDFGLASLASEGPPASGHHEVRGTLSTLAPEIIRGEAPTESADLFSLGAVVAHMLTGTPAFAAEQPSDTLDAILHTDPGAALLSDPRVPKPLAEVTAALLAKHGAERPPDATALAERLDGLMDALGRAEPSDLAAYLDDPATYTPPQPTALEANLHAATRPPRTLRPSSLRSSRRPAWTVWAVGVAVAAVLIAAAVWQRSDADGLPNGASVNMEEPRTALQILDPEVDSSGQVVEPRAGSQPDQPDEDRPAIPLPPESGLEDAPRAVVPETPVRGDVPQPSESRRDAPEPTATVAARPGTLLIAAEPWASVRVDGRSVGTTPLAPLTLAAGSYQVTFENPTFPTHTATVRVESGGTARSSVSLWSLVAQITLDVAPWARVFVDGALWDTVPPQSRALVLTPGDHQLRFEHPSLGTREMPLRVAAGERRTVRIRMADGG